MRDQAVGDLWRHVLVDERAAKRRVGMGPRAESAPAKNLAAADDHRGKETQVFSIREARKPEPLVAERLDRRLKEFREEERIRLERTLGEPADALGKARQGFDRLERKGAAPCLRPRRGPDRDSLLKHHGHNVTL